MTAHSLFFIELILVSIILISVFFLKKQKSTQAPTLTEQKKIEVLKKSPIVITSQDIRAIAGDDVITTQLDLARAYIEIGKTKLAKKILDHVIQHGNISQQQMAQQLIMAVECVSP